MSQTLVTSADTAIMRRGIQHNIVIFKNIIKNHEAQHAKDTFENRFSIPLRFTLKYIIFWVQFPFKDLLLTGDEEAAKRQIEDLNLSWVLKSDGNADLFKLDKDNLGTSLIP